MNVTNLLRAADLLDGCALRDVELNMRRFLSDDGEMPGCGTVACAAGLAYMHGIGFTPDMPRDHYGRPFFSVYVEWAFDLTGRGSAWCFTSEWGIRDNTREGAAARIRYLVDKGDVPQWFREYWSGCRSVRSETAFDMEDYARIREEYGARPETRLAA